MNRGASAGTPTLGEVRGKVVLAALHGAFGSPIERYGLSQFADWRDGSSAYMQNNYNFSAGGLSLVGRVCVQQPDGSPSSGRHVGHWGVTDAM